MPKRHSHYRSSRGRGGHGGHSNHGGRRRHDNRRSRSSERSDRNFFKSKGRHQSNWLKEVSPLGNGDLRNSEIEEVYLANPVNPGAVEDYYFGRHRDKSMVMGGFRPGLHEERPSNSGLGFRKRPMAFVKAKDVYDPSHDIIEKLRIQSNHIIQLNVEGEAEDEGKDEDGEHEISHRNDKGVEPEVTVERNNGLYRMDNGEKKNETDINNVPIEEDNGEKKNETDINNVPIEEDNGEKKNETNINNVPIEEDSKTFKDVQSVLSPIISKDSIERHSIESSKLSGTMERLQLSENSSNNSKSGEIPFGMAEEDSLANLSEISITNVRVGFLDDSYYVKCFRMFGDHESRWVDKQNLADFLLEELNLPEHRLNVYLQFIKESIMKKEESEPEPTVSDVASSSSDLSREYDERFFYREESISSDMREGLDDLIAYTEKYNAGRNMEYETSTLDFVARGKKKKLLIDESKSLDSAIAYALEDKLKRRLESKAKKRRTKQDFIDEINQFSEDLFKKYPIGLHVQNIKEECELFLLKDKDRLAFPPLDPHGNNVILKMSHHFNLKGYREGSGSNTHVIAQKTRATIRYAPNYDRIHQLLRQRPVFYRIDVNRQGKNTVERTRSPRVRFHTKEGQFVGQDAPVIGSDNIGRKMLEKLGWSNGEGLGAHGNKGIAEPLMARVKKNKSGLKQSQE